MERICDDKKCTGCMACYNICPMNAISMTYNERTELSPIIDNEKCINCNLCQTICPANNSIDVVEPKKVYACWNLDEEKRKTSSSGAIAYTLYEKIIENDGIVFGCSYDDNLQLKFSYAESINDIEKYKTSKYSHAYIGESYKKVEEFLNSSKEVLFVGTPCQIQGLKNFLRKDYDNLYLVDLICHGVPSQLIINEYIKFLNLDNKPTNMTFRGIYSFILTLYNNNDIIYQKTSKEDPYYYAFLNSLFYRESCYQCKFAQPKRGGDLTIGDFWKIGTDIPFNHDISSGVSTMLVNTEKGAKLFNSIKPNIFYEERTFEEAIAGNGQLSAPSKKNQYYDLFKELYAKYGFNRAMEECFQKMQELRRKYYENRNNVNAKNN